MGKPKNKEQITLYLNPEVKERLEMYCILSKRYNRTRIFNEALEEYLRNRLKSEYEKEGLIK